jgi:hypothetical protein
MLRSANIMSDGIRGGGDAYLQVQISNESEHQQTSHLFYYL